MNKTCLHQLLYVGLPFLLAACQASGQPVSTVMVQPGDTIDGMSLTIGAADAPQLWAFCSFVQHNGNTTTSYCSVPMLTSLTR